MSVNLLNLTITVFAAQGLALPRRLPSIDGSDSKHAAPATRAPAGTAAAAAAAATAAAQLTRMPTSSRRLRPFVKIELHVDDDLEHGAANPQAPGIDAAGGDDNDKEGEYKARTFVVRAGSGHNPDFGEEVLSFANVPMTVLTPPKSSSSSPSSTAQAASALSFVRFLVKDTGGAMHRDVLLGWAAVRLDRLQQGYRLVHLRDPVQGRPNGAVLLVKIAKHIT